MSHIIIVYLCISKENKLHIWHPNFIDACNIVPKATYDMNVHYHHEYKIYNFIRSLSFLTSIQIHDNTTYSAES